MDADVERCNIAKWYKSERGTNLNLTYRVYQNNFQKNKQIRRLKRDKYTSRVAKVLITTGDLFFKL